MPKIDPSQCFHFKWSKLDRDFVALWQCPEDLPYFDGHFPDQPVLPAVAIIDACSVALKDIDESFAVQSVESAKFMGPVAPGATITVRAQKLAPQGWRITWTEKDHLLAELRLLGDN